MGERLYNPKYTSVTGDLKVKGSNSNTATSNYFQNNVDVPLTVHYNISVVYCGPNEWRFDGRRGSSFDRKNTIRHLIQMMAITEEDIKEAEEAGNNSGSEEVSKIYA